MTTTAGEVTRWTRLVLGVILAAAVAAPVEAASPRPLVLTASRSASIDVTFPRTVTLTPAAVRVSGGRRYAGYFLQRVGAGAASGTGAMYLHAFRAPATEWVAHPLGPDDFVKDPPFRLPAGRYRLYALGDGPIEVRIPLAGYAGARTLRATRPVRVTYAVRDVTATVLPRPTGMASPGGFRADLPITVVSDASVSFSTIQTIRHGPYYASNTSQPESCIGAADRPACALDPKESNGAVFKRGQYTVAASPAGSSRFVDETGRYYFPGQIGAGDWTAHFSVVSTDTIDRAVVAAMSVGL